MRSTNTIIALIVAIVLAVLSFIILAVVGLGGERGAGKPITGGFYLQQAETPVMEDLTNVYNFVTYICLLYTSPSPRDQRGSRMPSSA